MLCRAVRRTHAKGTVILSLAKLVLLVLVTASVPLCGQTAASQQAAPPQPLLLGTAWYPEQWPEATYPGRWEADLQLMQEAHMNVVRVTEFAWSTLEPSDGKFDFGWMDRAIALAAKHHIAVVLGTPSAAPPAWLTTKYPDTLRVEENGRRDEHGNRTQFSFTSPRYRELSARIALKMAEHFGHNPNVIGWQLDNEIGAPSFDDSAKQQFHRWLQHRYGTIAELNRRWTTSYWSQTYDTFDQVPVHSGGENPGLLLDWRRFASDTWYDYCANQIAVIRPRVDKRQFITTNTMRWNMGFDHYLIHRELDLAAWDDYFSDGRIDVDLNAASHDLVRGYKQKNFWVMETQPGSVNWGPVNVTFPPGVTREMAWQAVGHGADAVLYWQWRSALNGQEEYHGTLLGADGTPVPVYAEIKRMGEEFQKVSTAMAATGVSFSQTSPKAEVAMINSVDSHYALDFQRHSQKFNFVGQFTDLYAAMAPLAQTIDIVPPYADLTPYKVVFAPALNVLPDDVAKNLLAYVAQGGELILGPRSGMKDVDNGLQPMRQPGPLVAALGGRVEQYYALAQPVPVSDGTITGTADVWAEALSASTSATKTVMTYGPNAGWLANQPAAISHTYGKGTITYVGAVLDQVLLKPFVRKTLEGAGLKPIVANLHAGVEVMERVSNGARVWIVINHSEQPQAVNPLHAGTDLLTGASSFPATLAPHGVVVWLLK